MRLLVQPLCSDLWSSLHVQTSGPGMMCRILLTQCLVVIVIIIIICFRHHLFIRSCVRLLERLFVRSRFLTIPSELQAV